MLAAARPVVRSLDEPEPGRAGTHDRRLGGPGHRVRERPVVAPLDEQVGELVDVGPVVEVGGPHHTPDQRPPGPWVLERGQVGGEPVAEAVGLDTR